MCGRYISISEKEELQKEFSLINFDGPIIKSYNIAPGQMAGIIINMKGYRYMPVKWGLVPSWSKDPNIGYKMINSRAETITEKPSFKAPFKRRRCLIPANGFYEWYKKDIQGRKKPEKIPYFIHRKENKPFSFAGLWEIWQSPEGGELYTFTIITTEAPDLIKGIHHRSPVIIPEKYRDMWLTTDETEYKKLLPLLKPYFPQDMEMYKVSTKVNNPKNNSPDCITAI